MKRLLVAICCLAAPIAARADSKAEIAEALRTQGPAIKQAMRAMDDYASSLNLDPMFVSYCRGELELHTYFYPTNGNIMFGFDYNKSTSAEDIKAAVSFRMQYELSYVMICLSGVKKSLDETRLKQ
jgi:hypothetical protein